MRKLALAVLAMALPLTGCEGVLDVTDPDIVTGDNLLDDLGRQTIRNGALGDFHLGYSGGASTDGQMMLSGLLTDEWMHSGTFTTRFQTEVRNIPFDNGTLRNAYFRLQRARNSLESAAEVLQASGGDPATDGRIPEMLAYAGLTYIAFAENYCPAVPFSKILADGTTEFGQPLTTDQILDRAIAQFDAALAHGAVTTDIVGMAQVGRGRALLDKGDFAGAAAAVGGVADDFAKFSRHSNTSNEQRNQIFEFNVTVGRWSLGDTEGVNGLDFRTAGDPRITSALCPGCAFDNSAQVPGTPAIGDNWWFTNYDDRSNPIPLASGIEARLIEAENQLQSNAVAWLATLNAMRANWANLAGIVRGDGTTALAPLVDPGTATGREDLHFRERAFWLFSTGHRLGDLRRMVRQYGRSADAVFPIGPYFK
ncbi:MAG: hypothetical protein ACE5FJ_06810, partial [Gemmatimonadales bacterium]